MDTGVVDGGSTLLDHALAALSADLDQLDKIVDHGELDGVDPRALLGYLQTFETFRNRLSLVDHGLVVAVQRADLASVLCQGNVKRVLTSALSISRAEAGRRVAAAGAVGPRRSMLAEELQPVRPHLAAAQQSGAVSADKVAIVNAALSKVDGRGFDPAAVDAGERLLADQAQVLPPEDLRTVAARVVEAIDPDGTLPDDELNQARRFFHLRPTPDGAWAGEFRLTGAAGCKLRSLLDPLAKVRVDASGDLDTRTAGQRRHDAVEDLSDRLLRAGDLPDTGGTPATVIVTINVDDLLGRCGYGTTTDGTIISVPTLLELADQADIIPAVLNAAGAVLHLGRSRRIATRNQTWALIARDGGCSFPACAHPPQWCERHHIVEWASGGLTDLGNLTLVCRYHHHNFLSRGWQVTLNSEGIPQWRPPRWVDPDQKPRINTRILARLLAQHQQHPLLAQHQQHPPPPPAPRE